MSLKSAFGYAVDFTLAVGCLVLVLAFTAMAAHKPAEYKALGVASIAPAVLFHALVVGTEMNAYRGGK